MSSTTFSRNTRNAGDIDKIGTYGSFRSLKRYDPEAPRFADQDEPQGKHDDIFKDNDFESFIAAVPTEITEEKIVKKTRESKEKRAHRKNREGRDNSEQRQKRSKEPRENSEIPSRERRQRSNANNEDESALKDKDEDFMNYLGQRHERRRKKKTEGEDTETINEVVKTKSNSRVLKSKNPQVNEHSESRTNSHTKLIDKENEPNNLSRRSSARHTNNQKDEKRTLNRSNSHSRTASSQFLKATEDEPFIESPKKSPKDQKDSKQQGFMKKPTAFSDLPPTPVKNFKNSESDESDNDGEVQVEAITNKAAQIEKINYSSEFFRPIKHCSTLQFLLTPAPPGKVITCRVRKGSGMFSDCQFYLEDYKDGIKTNLELLIKTSRRMTTAKVNHHINACNYDEFWTRSPNDTMVGRIVSNMSRKKFKLDLQYNDLMTSKEILNVEYKQSVGEPRKIFAKASLCSSSPNDNNQNDKITYSLKNRQPHYDSALRKYVLNYNGRAKLSSKHNFQIVDESMPEDILMQLGKVGSGMYNCDFSFPFCALQAFGFALSSLCR